MDEWGEGRKKDEGSMMRDERGERLKGFGAGVSDPPPWACPMGKQVLV